MGTIAVRSGIAGAGVEALAIQTGTHAGGLHGGAKMFKRKRTEGNHMTLQPMLQVELYLPELNSDYPVEVGSHWGYWILIILLNA